jgi:hypothetical protein
VKLARLSLLLVCVAAPTAGDIGSCGQPIAELDPQVFFRDKGAIDCARCGQCGFQSSLCTRACSAETAVEFEEHCYPLVHDGEVCLNALRAAGCSEYAAYVRDAAPTVPTECNFCPLDQRPGTGGSK